MQYNQLVRNRVPEIIAAEGKHPETQQMTPEAFAIALAHKLSEGVAEYQSGPSPDGLVDILEVIYAIAQEKYSLSPDELEKLRAQKVVDRGSFSDRTLLIEPDAA